MKIDSKILTKFVKKATLDGSIPSFIFRFGKDGLVIQSRETTNVAAVIANLDAKNIKQNEEILLPIKDSKRLIGMLSAFDGEIEMQKSANILSIFDKSKQVDIILSSEEFIENDLKEIPKINYDGGVNIESTIFKKAVKDMGILESKQMVVEFKNKKLNLIVGDKGFDQMIEKADADYIDCRSKFGEMIINVVSVLGDKANIGMKEAYPILIKETLEEGGVVKYIIAPLVEDSN